MVVVQAVLLYRLETWVLTVFHHRMAHRLMVRQPRRGQRGRGVYPSLVKSDGGEGVAVGIDLRLLPT